MWSLSKMTALVALTLHYLTEDFQMPEFTLESSPVQGNHTADMIRNSLISSFEKWGLNEGKLSLMLIHNNWKSLNAPLERLGKVLK